MPRFVAFLRAINVGGHVVKMEQLRRIFEDLGLTSVETFIASGNVVFESGAKSEEALRKKVEKRLAQELGYAVATFLRTEAELHRIASHEAFPQSAFRAPESRLFIGFLPAEPAEEARRKLIMCSSEADEFLFHEREFYWLCHVRSNESKFSGPRLEKTIGMPTTVRNSNTVRRLAARLSVAL